MEVNKKTCLIVEGGGFKTGFTAGILDAFLMSQYTPFQHYIGVSGGSIAVSYFLSSQYRYCLNAIRLLSQNEHFMSYKRAFEKKGMMDIDYLAKVAEEEVPFDLTKAMQSTRYKEVHFVATIVASGAAAYLPPNESNWLDITVASSTLPFVTKGRHIIDGVDYFDGGWSDPLPVKWAYEQGARKILLLRTWPAGIRSTQSWTDYFGSIYFDDRPGLKNSFTNSHLKYNEALDFIDNPPDDLQIDEIAPKKLLKSGTYTYTNKTIMSDYRYGVDCGLLYVYDQLGI